ncbi:MAG: PAS domain S-box protein, partial [Microcoleus sp.]
SPWFDTDGQFNGYVGSVLDISDRKQAEAELHEAHQRTIAIWESMTDAYALLDREWRVVYANATSIQTVCQLTGLEPDAILGKSHWELFSWTLGQPLEQEYRRAMAEQVPIHLEIFYEPTGNWFEIHGYPSEIGLGIYYRDISDRKLAEARVSESEEKYRSLFNEMSEGFCTVEVLYDEDGQPIDHRFLQANPAFERHTNLSDASGSLASELMPGLERVWNDLYARIIATGKSERIEQHSPAFDRWFEVEAARVGDASLCRVAVVFRDITDRKRAEEILRRTAELDAFRVSLTDALRPLTDASDILAIAARTLGESLRATRVIYFEVVSNGEEAIIHRNYTNGVAEMSGRYRFEDYRRNLTADHQAGKTQIVTNIPDNPKYNDAEKANYRELEIAAHIDVPLIKNNQFVAMLAVHQSTPRQWTETEVKLVEETAERTWAAVERARAEAALRQNEEQTRNILESIHEAFFALNENWQFTYLNPSVEALLDRTLSDLVGKNLWEEYPGLISSEFEHIYRGAMHDRVAGSLTQYYPDHDRWYEVRTYPAPNGISVYFRNVTEQIAAEAVLRESEERYRTLFESIDEGFCTVEMLFDENDTPIDYRFLEVNPRFEPQTGLRQAVGKRILEMLPEHEQHWFEIYGRIAMTGEPLRFENEARALNRWYDVYAYRVGEPEQRRVGILFRDISDRKLAEQKIQEQAALLDITSDAIFVRDLDHRILYWNQGAKQIYGWLATEAIGQTAYHLLQSNPDQIPKIMPMLLAQGEWQGELHKVTKTGKTVIVEARWTLMRDAADRPQFILSVDTDITEKKQLEAQFYRAQRLESVGTLASGIAHDLNNVLTPILAISQLLRLQQSELTARSQEMLQIVEDSAKRGANMVRQILTFTRGSGGERTLVEVAPLLQEVIKVVRQTFPKSITVREAIPVQFLSQVSADATQLHQLLMNLCLNARDAMPDGGTLTLAVANFEANEIFAQMNLDARVGQYVLIAVADTGTGIAPEVRDRIFDPFFTTKAPGKGTGLGLSTVLGIVRSDGGFVQVASEVGKGTQFKVYLPAIETKASRKLPQTQLPDGKGKLILVVDDEEPILQATRIILETHHYRVLTANSGMEAIATYAQHQQQIAVVLLDMMMPDMDGVTVIRILQKMNPEIRAIAASGLMPQYQQNLKSLGIVTCINKPYTTEELLNNIQLQGISIN